MFTLEKRMRKSLNNICNAFNFNYIWRLAEKFYANKLEIAIENEKNDMVSHRIVSYRLASYRRIQFESLYQ